MRRYTVRAGDTLGTISRIHYGTDQQETLIVQANPGVNVLTVGLEIIIPDLAAAPRNAVQNLQANSDDELALLINDQRFRFWENIAITLALDSTSTFSFQALFEPDNRQFVRLFRPLTYQDAQVYIGGKRLFSGNLLPTTPLLTDRNSVSVSGYSRAGLLNDCSAPASQLPLEFSGGQTLKQIADTLLSPFGLRAVFNQAEGPAFEQSISLSPSDKVLEFLKHLAQQRGLLLTDNASGDVVFDTEAQATQPVAIFDEGAAPLNSLSVIINAQQYYSDITGIQSSSIGVDGTQYTVKNPLLRGVLRPMTFSVGDVSSGELKKAVEAKMGRMFGEAVLYTLSVPSWRDDHGALWKPNTFIRLNSPRLQIANPFDFLIRRVTFNATPDSKTADFELVLPGSFNGTLPKSLPWD